MTGTGRYQSHFSLPSPTSSTPALFPSSAPPRWLQYCGPPRWLSPSLFGAIRSSAFEAASPSHLGYLPNGALQTGPDNKRVGLGWAQPKIIHSWTSLLACYPSFSPPTLMQGPRRPPTADELLQVPLHETKGNPPILLVRIRDTPPPKMAVCDRAAQLIRTRPRDTHRLRPSTARLGDSTPPPHRPAPRNAAGPPPAGLIRLEQKVAPTRSAKRTISINLLRSHQGKRLGCWC